jgi:acyl-CoA thioester hydrolase
MDLKKFELNVRVLPQDIDAQDHVNNTVYLRWVQDAAVAHWRAIASPQAQRKIGWVVVRHEIDYKAPGSLGDEVVLRTWVGEATRLRFERLTEILRKSDQRLLATARTLWVPINSATGKPTRVGAEVREQFSV